MPGRRIPCPYCGEGISPDALRCRFCGEDLDDNREWDETNPLLRRDLLPHRGGLILTLGVIGLGAGLLCGPLGVPFAIAAWVMGQADLPKMDAHILDPRGRRQTNAGRVCGIVGTFLGIVRTLLFVAVMRL
jgi:hypothetical protein